MSKKRSMADLVKTRIAKWKSDPDSLWKDVVERSKKLAVAVEAPRPNNIRVEATVIAALRRLGDVRKALQLLNSAPIAPKTEATLKALKALHPTGPNPAPVPPHEMVHFAEDVVRKSLCSFGPGSAAGVFGYKPFLLQQCVRAESYLFTRALTSAVNQFAAGLAPRFLRRYVAGGSVDCTREIKDSWRGKSKAFAGRNDGIGCPGGVEVVAHSLRDCLNKHKGSKLGLLKIDFF